MRAEKQKNKFSISFRERETKKERSSSNLINYYKKTNSYLINILSQSSGFIPLIGPIKSLSEGIIGKDVGIFLGIKIRNRFIKNKEGSGNIDNEIITRTMKVPERLLKILAGGSGLTGYYILINGYLSPQGVKLEQGADYVGLEILNTILYTSSLIAAFGIKETVNNTKKSVIAKTQKISKLAKKREIEEKTNL